MKQGWDFLTVNKIRLAHTVEAPGFREDCAGKLTRRAARLMRKFEKLRPRVSDAILNKL
jgi:hypothetical protein